MTQSTGKKSCCGPSRDGISKPNNTAAIAQPNHNGSVIIPGGQGIVGTKTPQVPDDGEGPLRKTTIKPFRMGVTAVTNEQFAKFVDKTNYVTEAERFGWSFVFWSDVPAEIKDTQGVPGAEWWRRVDGATWRNLNGPDTQKRTWHADHPVVQVSWNDAKAYANWVGGRLPTEAEWEHAARGGLGDAKFPWGDTDPDDTKNFPCNIWQGKFPETNSVGDGWAATSPADAFRPNGYGLYNVVGNVWEWSADSYRVKSLKKRIRRQMEHMQGYKLTKGGSFLCHRSYCYRYRIAARTGNSPDSATTHMGFRVVWDISG